MFKSIVLTLFFSSTLIALTDQPNYSQQISNNLPLSTMPNSFEANPVCMMQLENGTIINLSSMCTKVYDEREARNRANIAITMERLSKVCLSPNLNAGMRQLCENRFPSYFNKD